MEDFFSMLFQYSFMQNALLGGILISIGCGVMGTFVVIKRISYISGGIAHAVLGGMGIAYYYNVDPILGATVFALLGAILLGVISIRVRQHEDTVIGALWAIGMAVGILFISMTPGYNVDLMSFLFGNILMVSRMDLMRMALLNSLILGIVFLFYRHFLAICFDEEYAHLRKIKVEILYILLLCLVSLTVVTMIQMVGLILVIALLTLPGAMARLFVRTTSMMMVFAVLLGSLFTIIGLALSFGPDLPSGAVIILVTGTGYLLAIGVKGFWSLVKERKGDG